MVVPFYLYVQETLGEDFLNVPAAITDRLINTRKLRVRRTRAQQKLQLEALQVPCRF
jgi:hypothetical protein